MFVTMPAPRKAVDMTVSIIEGAEPLYNSTIHNDDSIWVGYLKNANQIRAQDGWLWREYTHNYW